MYALKPTKLYMLDTLQDNGDAMARIERMVAATGGSLDDVRVFSRGGAYDVAREIREWPPDDLPSDIPVQHQRPWAFTRLVTNGDEADQDPLLVECPEGVDKGTVRQLLGYIDPVRNYHVPEKDAEENMVCWPTKDFGVMEGCPHGCLYCGAGRAGRFFSIGANIEQYVDEVVGPTAEATPQQRCFRMIGWGADIITFEPEYRVFEPYLAKLAEHDRYGYFHTGSDNVDWIADLPNRDRLIGIWSLACGAMARDIEPGSPSDIDRIEAGRKCREMGIPARYKLKPMIPIRNWREEYSNTIRELITRAQPETVGFCVIMWQTVDQLKSIIDPDLLDPDYLRAAEEAAEEMAGVKTGPYPHHVRAEIYRYLIGEVRKWDREIPIFMSTESREMWADMADEIGQSPRMFACGCNPVQVPGPEMRVSKELPHSTYFEPGSDGGK